MGIRDSSFHHSMDSRSNNSYHLCNRTAMKHRITEQDYIKANRKASREEEILLHGKQIFNRVAIHKSKKQYNRQQAKKVKLTDIE